MGRGAARQGLVRCGGWGAGQWVILAPNEEWTQELCPKEADTWVLEPQGPQRSVGLCGVSEDGPNAAWGPSR